MADRHHVIVQSEQVQADGAQLDAGAVVPVVIPEVVPLPEVLRQIRRDSSRDPQQYLDETIVPFGGE